VPAGIVEEKVSLTDAELIAMALSGDQMAYRQLVLRYESRVAATVIGMLGYCPEAEDVGQETFIRFFKSIERFRGDSSVGTYITRIAINLSLNELKKRKRRNLFFQDKPIENLQVSDESGAFVKMENRDYINKALMLLNEKDRAVILLRLSEGCSTEETATILDMPVGSVLSRLSRAQKKLKELVKIYL